MKSLGLIFLILISSVPVWALRSVEFEWEEVDGANQYQVEVKNKGTFLKTFKSKTNIFKLKISPGKYLIRGKVFGVNPELTHSDWSEWKEFDVPPAKLETLALPKTEFKVSPHSFVSDIPLQWKAIDGAKEYLVEILDSAGKVQKTVTVTESQVALKLRPGFYSVRITSKTADGLASEPFELPQQITVQNIPIADPKIVNLDVEKGTLQGEGAPGTVTVVGLYRQAFLGTEWKQIEQKPLENGLYTWPSPLKPGKYKLTLLSKNPFNEISKPVSKEFEIKPKEQDLPK